VERQQQVRSAKPVSRASSFVVLRGPATVAGPPAYRLSHLLWLAQRVPARSLRGAQCSVTVRGG
jgi:hypothetical protein